MPITRLRENLLSLNAAWDMASSGLETTMRMQLGEFAVTFAITSCMIRKLVFRRSSLLMPGLRAIPAVMTTISEFAVSA